MLVSVVRHWHAILSPEGFEPSPATIFAYVDEQNDFEF